MAMTTLEVRDGYFTYPGASEPVLAGINLQLRGGELLAILGPNGAGKTTLMRTMIGLQSWDRGATYVDGTDIASLSSRELGRSIAYVPQARHAGALSLSGVEMVQVGRASHLGLFAQPGPKEYDLAYRTLERIGAAHLADISCAHMSGGQFQLILIARALVAEPKIMVLDEPETGLDFRNQLVVLELVRELAESGLIVVMNTHYPSHALRIAHQTMLISAASPVRCGPTAQVMTEENLSELFGVTIRISQVRSEDTDIPVVVPASLNEIGDGVPTVS